MRQNIIVGMSGGVDSSIAAYLLKKQGYHVTGVTMAVWKDGPSNAPKGKHACFGPDEKEEIEETQKIADMLGISLHVFDCSDNFHETVLKYFKDEYLSGHTPNPCIICNQKIKLKLLPELARSAGLSFDKFATGHYANIEYAESQQRWLLKKGIDTRKDQSYFLYRLSQEQLSGLLFPLGNKKKEEIKQLAREINLPVYDKKESQDFYAGDYKDLLSVEAQEGNIVDSSGKILGRHTGFWNFTVGQRKGLRIAYPEPLYVLSLNSRTNEVLVGTMGELHKKNFLVKDCVWIAIDRLIEPMQCTVKIRYAQREMAAIAIPMGEHEISISLPDGGEAISPGQSAVLYDNDMVIGGGIISKIL